MILRKIARKATADPNICKVSLRFFMEKDLFLQKEPICTSLFTPNPLYSQEIVKK
jgi:hypothetical protein